MWHRRLGNTSERALLILVKRGYLKGAQTCKLEFCEHCVIGKQRRVKFGTVIHNTEGIIVYVHSDVWGDLPSVHLLEADTTLLLLFMKFPEELWCML